ncbi:MAG: GNAT family N-acetyltransferase [Clostridia bacterium]|nr:GNAT family N-acetyltransferase [Clostridia bacterium]
MEVKIRKYQEKDKERLRFICSETAGEYFRKSDEMLSAVPAIYNDYFTENEPQNIFVATDENDEAQGYIICCTEPQNFRKKMIKKYIPKAVKKSVKMLPACMGYMASLSMAKREDRVHLHIDILPQFQHMGVGTLLIDALRNHLKNEGIKELCVNTIDPNESAYKFYKKYGFKDNKKLPMGLVSLKISTDK